MPRWISSSQPRRALRCRRPTHTHTYVHHVHNNHTTWCFVDILDKHYMNIPNNCILYNNHTQTLHEPFPDGEFPPPVAEAVRYLGILLIIVDDYGLPSCHAAVDNFRRCVGDAPPIDIAHSMCEQRCEAPHCCREGYWESQRTCCSQSHQGRVPQCWACTQCPMHWVKTSPRRWSPHDFDNCTHTLSAVHARGRAEHCKNSWQIGPGLFQRKAHHNYRPRGLVAQRKRR